MFEDPKGPMILTVAAVMQLVGSIMLWKIIHIEV
jgi:Flp pilus assembly protein TadB